MTESKGLPKSVKKSCYNYRCKYWQHFTFDPKSKTDSVTQISKSSCGERTTGKSFYEQQLRLEELEGKMQGTT
jgi:pyruvate/2-oxoacid:ferredoxin oxidoreductase beta subunit